ncbi:MAG: hypothetical protein HN590_08175 [Calditrichaeota bacterium]|nr:hypothetical protein [Calditrichota bacterium]
MIRKIQKDNDMTSRLLKSAVILLAALVTVSAADEWEIFTDHRDIRDLTFLDGKIWCATSGGLASLDIETKKYEYFSPVDELCGTSINHLALDSSGGMWLSYDNCTMQRFQPGIGVTHNVMGLDHGDALTSINDMKIGDMGIFLATNRGASWIKYSENFDRWVWFAEYTNMGSLPAEQIATSIYQDDHFIWVGTQEGIARGDLNTPPPHEWIVYTTDDGLRSKDVSHLIKFQDKITALTDKGISQWSGSRWETISTTEDIRGIDVFNDSLRIIRRDGVYTQSGNIWEQNTPRRNLLSSMVWDHDGGIWVGMHFDGSPSYKGGIALAGDSTFTEYVPNGPISNGAFNFDFTSEGDVLMVGGRTAGHLGLCRYNGNEWRVWSYPRYKHSVFGYQHHSVLSDMDGGIWVGTWGGGMARYQPNGDSLDIYNHTVESGERLSAIPGSPRYIVVPDLELDEFGNVWAVNRSATNGNVLICIPRDFVREPSEDKTWIYFHRSLFRNFPHFDRVTIDGQGRKWIASGGATVIDGQGVYAIDDNGTLNDPTDDQVWGPFPGLESPRVYSLEWDDDGYIWAGTADGAYYINTNVGDLSAQGFTRLWPLRNHQVNCIEIDASSNKWFGTTTGIFIVAPDLFTVIREINTDQPDLLPSVPVKAIAINPHTGWAYIGTDLGTAAMFTAYRDYGEVLEKITIEPNPFNPNEGRLMFTGNSLANMAEARIYTPDGRLVRKLDHNAAALGWNGRTDHGNKTASGVYLILTYSSEGKSAQEKVAVVWK